MQLFGTKGQKFIHCPETKGTTGQAQNFATGRDWPGRAGTTSQNLGWDRVLMFCHGKGRDGIYSACSIPSRKIPGQPWGKREKIVIKSKFLKKKGRIFFAFFLSFENFGPFLDVPGQRGLSRNVCCCSCPYTKGQRDKKFVFVPGKGTVGQGNLFVLGQWDNGMSSPGLSWNVLSHGNPTRNHVRGGTIYILGSSIDF